MKINVSKGYQHQNRKLIFEDILDVTRDQNKEMNLNFIKKESDIFWLLFLSDSVTIFKLSAVEHIGFSKKLPVAVLLLVDYQGNLAYGEENMEALYVIDLFITQKNWPS